LSSQRAERRTHVYCPLSAQTACISSSRRAERRTHVYCLSARRTQNACILSSQRADRMYIVLSARRTHIYCPLSAQPACVSLCHTQRTLHTIPLSLNNKHCCLLQFTAIVLLDQCCSQHAGRTHVYHLATRLTLCHTRHTLHHYLEMNK